MWTTLAVGKKELRQILRDRRTLVLLLLLPFGMLLIFGYALNFDIRHVRLAVEDRDGSRESRALVSGFTNSGYFDLAAVIRRPGDALALMDRDEVRAALVIPEDFSERLNRGEVAPVQVLVNGTNASAASTVVGYAFAIVRAVSFQVQPTSRLVMPALTAETRVWYNPELRSAIFLIPGLIAYIAMITAVISTALSIVREKERGTMEQVRMAPMGTVPYILGKTTPYYVISLASSLVVVFASMVLFDVPMRGSWLLLFIALSLFLFGALGTGLLVSTIAESQQVAFQMSLLAAFLPTLILSGFVFPIDNIPVPIQIVSYIVPARYFLFALRGVMLKGVGIATIWPALASLVVYAMVVLGLASLRLARERR